MKSATVALVLFGGIGLVTIGCGNSSSFSGGEGEASDERKEADGLPVEKEEASAELPEQEAPPPKKKPKKPVAAKPEKIEPEACVEKTLLERTYTIDSQVMRADYVGKGNGDDPVRIAESLALKPGNVLLFSQHSGHIYFGGGWEFDCAVGFVHFKKADGTLDQGTELKVLGDGDLVVQGDGDVVLYGTPDDPNYYRDNDGVCTFKLTVLDRRCPEKDD